MTRKEVEELLNELRTEVFSDTEEAIDRQFADAIKSLPPDPLPDPDTPGPIDIEEDDEWGDHPIGGNLTWPHRIQPIDPLDVGPDIPSWVYDTPHHGLVVYDVEDHRTRGFLHRVSLARCTLRNCHAISDRYAMFSSAGMTDCLFQGCSFTGTQNEAAVRLYNAERCVFRNCDFRTHPQNRKHTLRLYGSREVLFEGCEFTRGRVKLGGPDSSNAALDPKPLWTRDIVFRNCHFAPEGNARRFDLWNCANIKFENCTITRSGWWHLNDASKVSLADMKVV